MTRQSWGYDKVSLKKIIYADLEKDLKLESTVC